MNSTNTVASQRPRVEAYDVLLAFLRLVLPDQGFYATAIKKKRAEGVPREFHKTIEDLRNALLEADKSGREVYFAVASFKSNANGKVENVAALKCFRADVDFRAEETHKRADVYATKEEAFAAVKGFCEAVGLPTPLIVGSGGGLHVYWPLREALPVETWRQYSEGLKAVSLKWGLRSDTSVTTNAAGILRPPYTMNRKLPGKERPVTFDPRALELGAYDLTQFSALLEGGPDVRLQIASSTSNLLKPRPAYLSARARSDALHLRLIGGLAPPLADAALIASRCAQLAYMRDTRGAMPETPWYACIGVLAFCEDGEALAHEWSRGDDRYDARETKRKFDQRAKLTGATLCASFQELGGETRARCDACSHKGKIKSPIVLGAIPHDAIGGGAPKGETSTARTNGPMEWDLTAGGAKKSNSYANAALAIDALGVRGRHDIFHDRKIIAGDLPENLGRELSDVIVRAVREMIVNRFKFDPKKENVQEALERLCEANRFDPVADYLDSRQWDGKARLDTWLTVYLGVDDTPLNRAFGRKTLIAAVRRVRQPGCKFDFMLVLEGLQGAGKSCAVRILAVSDENYSDQPITWSDHKQQQEAVGGVWLHEIGELAGLRKADVEHVKNFLSRQNDRARPSYGRFVVDRPRRGIFIGTVNGGRDAGYLTDPSGGRRFWPVEVGRIDLEGLLRDRDQLWSEAATIETKGEGLSISPDLYEAARVQQEQRRPRDPWTDLLAGVSGARSETPSGPVERVTTKDLLARHLDLTAAQATHGTLTRLAGVMRGLGWRGPLNMRTEAGGVARGYERAVTL